MERVARILAEAEVLLLDSLKLVPKMSADEAIVVMRAICDLCRAKERKDLYREAVATIDEIMRVEEKCPVARAGAGGAGHCRARLRRGLIGTSSASSAGVAQARRSEAYKLCSFVSG